MAWAICSTPSSAADACTRERPSVARSRLDADYPGFGHCELLDIVASTDRAVGRAHVTGDADGVTQHFEVASFVTERDGLIAELVEVWADVGVAPPEGTRPG